MLGAKRVLLVLPAVVFVASLVLYAATARGAGDR
jgi:Flp pilus assembly protein protease CpaA